MKTIDAVQMKKEISQYSDFFLAFTAPLDPVGIGVKANKVIVSICGDVAIHIMNEYIQISLYDVIRIDSEDYCDSHEYIITCNDRRNPRKPKKVSFTLECS